MLTSGPECMHIAYRNEYVYSRRCTKKTKYSILIDPMPCKIDRNGLVRIVANLTVALLSAIHCPESRVGHRVLFRSVRSVLFRSFFEFLATYETQKNVPFFSSLF